MLLEKKEEMNEENIKLNFITPALNKSGWKNGVNILMEKQVTDGRINLTGNLTHRDDPKKADYLLYINKDYPIAVVEAKANKHSITVFPTQ